MKSKLTVNIGGYYVRGKYNKDGSSFEDFTVKVLTRFTSVESIKNKIRKDYSEFNCTVADISIDQIKEVEIDLMQEYLKAQKKTANDKTNIANG